MDWNLHHNGMRWGSEWELVTICKTTEWSEIEPTEGESKDRAGEDTRVSSHRNWALVRAKAFFTWRLRAIINLCVLRLINPLHDQWREQMKRMKCHWINLKGGGGGWIDWNVGCLWCKKRQCTEKTILPLMRGELDRKWSSKGKSHIQHLVTLYLMVRLIIALTGCTEINRLHMKAVGVWKPAPFSSLMMHGASI